MADNSQAANLFSLELNSSYDTDTAVEAALGLMNYSMPFEDPSISDSDLYIATQAAEAEGPESGQLANPQEPTSIYHPEFSDISEDEMVEATQVAEKTRFKRPIGDSNMDSLAKRRLADSTMRKVKWAKKLFDDWLEERNRRATAEPSLNISPITVKFEDMTKDELNYSISRFIVEISKQNGDEYPGNTLYEIVLSLQMHLENNNIMYKLLSDEAFIQIKNTLDNRMKALAGAGIGTDCRKAQVITREEEEELWAKNILGSDTPEKLFRTLVYLIGLNFALRGGNEHRSIRRGDNSQLSIGTNDKGHKFLRYREDVSKANQGGLKHRHIKRKVVMAFANESQPERCIVNIYNKYLTVCPEVKCDAFYLRPLQSNINWTEQEVWFAKAPVGRQKLAGVVACICKAGGLQGYRSNHSLRASAATRLYEEGVDEQLIKEVTGHRSDAVREYKRSTTDQIERVNKIVQGCPDSASTSKPIEQDARNVSINININV